MNSTIFFTICSFFYSILLCIVYFSKERIKSVENKIYSWLLLVNLVGILIELVCLFTSLDYLTLHQINIVCIKFYLLYLLTWVFIFTIYVITISVSKITKYIVYLKRILFIIYWICVILIFLLPVYLNVNNNIAQFPYGPAVDLQYPIGIFCSTLCFAFLLKNIKYIKNKKYLPIFAFIIGGLIVVSIQHNNPQLLLMTSMETLVTVLMYFTIENPDMKMIAELNIARDQAEKANQAKSDFLSNMSHEIRTPLNAIVGFSQALQEDENLPESAKDEVNDIISASNSLLEIVNGILDISKIEADKLEIINTEYNFKKVFNELVSLTKARLGDKPLDLRFSYDDSIPGVLYGDHSRIKQIILNLLTNAVKYTKEGYVELKVSSVIQGDVCRLIVSVEDSGIGIKNENIDKLFSKFERFDLEKNMTIEGTGLGLAITKKLVELMNGKIVVQSVYGKGSKFTVAIDQKIVAGKEVTVEESQTDIEIFDASDKKILVVDDNKINLKVASRLLSNYNVQIETVESGFDCLEKVKSCSYDLILMDDMMPKMSGVETFHKLRDSGNNTPCVALTANAISGMKEKYLNEGFNDYLSKPIDKLELNIIMNKYLRK